MSESLEIAKIRGTRVKKIRNMANLTQEQMCEDGELNPHTLAGWEVGRHGGLSKKGAQKIVNRVAQEQVICSVDWLLQGSAPEPYVLSRSAGTQSQTDAIQREIDYFLSNNIDAVIHQMTDDAMLPLAKQGDVVGGIKLAQAKWSCANNQMCIVATDDGQMMGLLKHNPSSSDYYLYPSNLNDENTYPVFKLEKLLWLAPMVWLRRKQPCS